MPRHKRIKHFAPVLILVLAFSWSLFSACNKSGGNSLHVKSNATGEKDLAVKAAFADPVTKTFTDINQKITTAVVYNVYAANYDLDPGRFGATLNNPMTSDDNVRVQFGLVGEEGTRENSPLKAGTYSAKADKYMKLETVGIVTRKGGVETKTWLDRSTLNGQVKVNSVSDDSASGDIDVMAGDVSLKGSFTAKILKRK